MKNLWILFLMAGGFAPLFPAHAQTMSLPGFVTQWQQTWSRGTFDRVAYIPEGAPPPSGLGFHSEISGNLYFIVNLQQGRVMPRDQFGRRIREDGRTRYYIQGLRLGRQIIVTYLQRL